ncbi:unnamed protein product [Amoebophrya sp. A120]|nr:unnamed protein product [Amoebophrya sp. A120]|eukprot:GSA120T00019263001.1
MVKEALMSDEELHQAMIQNLNPRLVLNPYRYFLVPGKEGEHYCGEMEGITVYLPPNAPEGPNGLAMVHAQKQFIKHAYTNKRGIVPRQMNLELKAPPGAQQPGPHAVSTAVNPYDESMEMLRIQYKDGTVRLWSDREVRMFCVLRKPNRQEFLDIQAVQILPFAGMHQTPQSLQFVTYNYNEKLIALKTKMRARSPKKDKVVYDPVPARPLSPKRPVPLPFDKAKQQDEEEEPPAAAAAKKEKKQKSKDKAAGDKSPEKGAAGAGEQNKDKAADKDKHDENKHGSSKEHASPSKDKHGGAGHHSPLLQTPPPYDPLTSPHLSPDLELMKGFFPEAHVVVAEQYDDGKIYFHEEEATRIRALQRSLSPERYGKKGKRKAKPVLESSPESPGSKEKSVKIMGSEQHGGSKSSTAGAGNQNHAGSSKERASTQSPPPAIKTPGGAAAKHADAPSTPTKSQHQQPHGSPKAAEAAPAAAPAAAGAPPPEMHTGPKKKHEPLEHLGEIPETHFYMKNNEREELMEETIDKLNGWLTEKYGLRIFSGVFEFAFAKIDVPSKEFQRVSAKKNSVQAIMAEKKQQRIKKTPKQVVEELQETRLRCYLMNAAKLLVGKAERKKKKEDRPSSRGSSPSPYASEADEDMYAYDSPGDDSQGQTSPGADSSPGGPSEAATDAQSPAAQRKKRPKWRTEAGPEMLTNMIDLWEPIRLECSTDPLAEFKNQLSQSTGKSKSGDTDKNSVEMMVRATVDAAREGTPFDHVPFLKEIPAQCHDKLVESKIDLFQKEHTVTEKTRVGPIGAMLRKPLLPGVVGGNLPRTNSEPVMSGHALSHRGRSTGTPVKMNQYGGSGGPSMSHGAPHGMMMNGNNNFSSTTPNTANNFLGHAPIVPMGSTGGIMMGSHPTSGRQLLSAGTNSSKFSAGVPQMSSTPGSRVHTRPTSIAQNVVQQQMMQTTNTSSTPSRSRKELPKNSMEKVDVSRIFLGGENLHLIQTKNSDAGRAVPPDEFTILSPRRKDIGRTTTDSLSDLLGGSKTREK